MRAAPRAATASPFDCRNAETAIVQGGLFAAAILSLNQIRPPRVFHNEGGKDRRANPEKADEWEYRPASRQSNRVPQGSLRAPQPVPARDGSATRGYSDYHYAVVRWALVGRVGGSSALGVR